MLKKELKILDVFCISSGAMISSGIFILPGLAFSKAGPSVIISYLLAGLLALIGMLSVIELSTAMPKAGGDYFFINKSLGPLVGTVSGLLGWSALSLKSAFAIFGMAEMIYLATGIDLYISSIAICLFFVFLNIFGVGKAAKFQLFLVLGLLFLMSLYIVLGLPKVTVSHFVPFAPHGINSIIATSGFIFISFGGLLKVASISEEIKNPKKNIPLGMISSVIAVTAVYTLLLFVLVGTLDSEQLVASLTPVAISAKIFMGNPGFIAISIAALLAFITTANAGLMAASRYPLALSRDKLLPNIVGKVSKKFKTPIISILMTGVFILLALLLKLETLVKAASTVILTSYVLTNISVIIFRESKIENYQPSFKAPFYPWVQIFGIIIFLFFIIDMGLEAIEISISFIAFSLGVYFFYGRKKIEGTYALLHLIANIKSKNISSRSLETELREIIYERDDIIKDRFDYILEKATIIDVEEKLSMRELYYKISKQMAPKLNFSTEEIYKLFLAREKDVGIVITPGLAIPHINVGVEGVFNFVVARCKKGVYSPGYPEPIHKVFALINSKSERSSHLRALMAIANIFREDSVSSRWLNARNVEQIRDILLLSSREREIFN